MRILYLDIETAPNKGYFWGLFGQNIAINQIEESGYTLCWAAKWEGGSNIMFDSLWDSDTDMILKMYSLLEEADAVVHYNGRKFDIPVLNWEFCQLGLAPPDSYHQIDLYRTVKQNFKLPSYKLDYVSQALGLGGKVQHKGMELWKGCMDNNTADYKIMQRYNMQDVRLLARLYKRLLPWIKDHPNYSLYKDTSRPLCTNCGSHYVVKKGIETTLTMQYQRYRCTKCGTPLRGRVNISPSETKKNTLSRSKL